MPTNGQYKKRELYEVKYIVIHHSGVDVDNSAREIADYHVNVLGWPGIGYPFVLRWDGAIEQAHDLETMSFNVAKRNHEVVGICCVGNYINQPGRPAQMKSKDILVAWLLAGSLPGWQVVGHREIALPGYETACPGMLI